MTAMLTMCAFLAVVDHPVVLNAIAYPIRESELQGPVKAAIFSTMIREGMSESQVVAILGEQCWQSWFGPFPGAKCCWYRKCEISVYYRGGFDGEVTSIKFGLLFELDFQRDAPLIAKSVLNCLERLGNESHAQPRDLSK